MNENQDPKHALAYDTTDLEEAVTIAAILYVDWRRHCEFISRCKEPSHLGAYGSDRYVVIPGYPPEPQAAFCKRVLPISAVARMALGVEKPAGLVLRTLARTLVDDGAGEEFADTVGDIADFVAELIDTQHAVNGEALT
jgi:hypothetical protein